MQDKSLLRIALIVGMALAPSSGVFASQPVDPARPLADFDGDWYADLAVGAPNETIGAVGNAGWVNVIYGADGGLNATDNQGFSQDDSLGVDASEADDHVGAALAVGDFNGDGRWDLAAGVPGESLGTAFEAGAVHVVYGTALGLRPVGNQLWHQGVAGMDGALESGDRFGHALAVGDFNDDSYGDLAVGVPFENVGSVVDAGLVQIIYGSSAGLTAAGNQLWDQDQPDIDGMAETGDALGKSLAAGDFNRDGYVDLAVGVANESVGSPAVASAGMVHVLFGGAAGLSAVSNQLWHQGVTDMAGAPETNDQFGAVLAAGDFGGDGYADLAIGVINEDVGSPTVIDAGAVQLLYGSAAGLTAAGNQLWHADIAEMAGTAETSDHFGSAVAAGDFDGDGYADLAVGVIGESVGSPAVEDAGAVHVIYGTATGLRVADNRLWHQDSTDIEGVAEISDAFGFALAAGDFNSDSYADLAVGVPSEDVGSPVVVDAGVVQILYGSVAGLSAAGNQLWHQDVTDIEGMAESGDEFGYAVAAVPYAMHRLHLPVIVRN